MPPWPIRSKIRYWPNARGIGRSCRASAPEAESPCIEMRIVGPAPHRCNGPRLHRSSAPCNALLSGVRSRFALQAHLIALATQRDSVAADHFAAQYRVRQARLDQAPDHAAHGPRTELGVVATARDQRL